MSVDLTVGTAVGFHVKESVLKEIFDYEDIYDLADTVLSKHYDLLSFDIAGTYYEDWDNELVVSVKRFHQVDDVHNTPPGILESEPISLGKLTAQEVEQINGAFDDLMNVRDNHPEITSFTYTLWH